MSSVIGPLLSYQLDLLLSSDDDDDDDDNGLNLHIVYKMNTDISVKKVKKTIFVPSVIYSDKALNLSINTFPITLSVQTVKNLRISDSFHGTDSLLAAILMSCVRSDGLCS